MLPSRFPVFFGAVIQIIQISIGGSVQSFSSSSVDFSSCVVVRLKSNQYGNNNRNYFGVQSRS